MEGLEIAFVKFEGLGQTCKTTILSTHPSSTRRRRMSNPSENNQ